MKKIDNKPKKIASISNELIKQSQESALAAVQIFNNPLLTFKVESFIVLINIAWTYLLHAYYRKNKMQYVYFNKNTNRYQKTKGGKRKSWDLKQCLDSENCPLEDVVKQNLHFLIDLRNEITHNLPRNLNNFVGAKLQACCINYNLFLKKIQPKETKFENITPIALQFFTFQEEQIDSLKNKNSLPINIITFISEFENNKHFTDDPKYSYKVIYLRETTNNKNQADSAVRFIDHKSKAGIDIQNILIKTKENDKYTATQVVKEINKKYPNFNMREHTTLWKKHSAKGDKKYGITVANKVWYWYGTWINFILIQLEQKNST